MRAVVYIRKMEKMDRQQRRTQGQVWLYEAVTAYGLPQLNGENCPVERTEKGKPYFAERPDVCFSISHSGDYWACAVADGPVGLDLQFHKTGRLENIPGRFFHPQEAAWLENREREAFFEVWTAKESYVKWTGEGIDRSFGQFSVVDEAGLMEQGRPEQNVADMAGTQQAGGPAQERGSAKEVFFYRPAFEQGYSLCLCGGEAWEDVKIVRAQETVEETRITRAQKTVEEG